MKKILALAALAFSFAITAQSQTGLVVNNLGGYNPYVIPSTAADTAVKSTTNFWVAPAAPYGSGLVAGNNGPYTQDVSYTFAVDSTGGSPACTMTTYVSNDKVHWTAVGSAVVISTHSTWHVTSTVPGVSDTCVTVNTNPWTGSWIGFKIVWTSATQRAVYHITVSSKNTY